jgi:chorismate dehydratase
VRIGKIPYLNCEPFFAHLPGDGPGVEMTPRALGRAMRAGLVDAAPLSLVDLHDLGSEAVALPFGIAVRGSVRSVLLFSRLPLDALEGATIGVTDETSTSVELLRVLLALRLEVEPARWVRGDESADAILLIGDQALRALGSAPERPHRLDLAEAWTSWTGLPFVFARWGVRAAVPATDRQQLTADLDTALRRGLEANALRAIARRRRDTGLTEMETMAYLSAFTYRLGPDEDKAIAEFRRLRGFVGAARC